MDLSFSFSSPKRMIDSIDVCVFWSSWQVVYSLILIAFIPHSTADFTLSFCFFITLAQNHHTMVSSSSWVFSVSTPANWLTLYFSIHLPENKKLWYSSCVFTGYNITMIKHPNAAWGPALLMSDHFYFVLGVLWLVWMALYEHRHVEWDCRELKIMCQDRSSVLSTNLVPRWSYFLGILLFISGWTTFHSLKPYFSGTT